MRKLLALVLLLVTAAPALAVDNTLLVTPCAAGCITTRSKDIGAGVQAPMPILSDTSGTPIYGTAGTANANVLTVQGIASMTPLAASQSGTWNITNISGTVSLPTGAATSANQATEITSLATIATNTGAAIPAGTALIGNSGLVLPAGSTPIQATATGTTGATTATMAADATQFNFICGLSIRANATAAATGNATVTGLATSPLNFTQWTAPNASGLGVTEQVFTPCQPSSAINTAIAVVSAAPGTGGVISVTVWGFKKVASP